MTYLLVTLFVVIAVGSFWSLWCRAGQLADPVNPSAPLDPSPETRFPDPGAPYVADQYRSSLGYP